MSHFVCFAVGVHLGLEFRHGIPSTFSSSSLLFSLPD